MGLPPPVEPLNPDVSILNNDKTYIDCPGIKSIIFAECNNRPSYNTGINCAVDGGGQVYKFLKNKKINISCKLIDPTESKITIITPFSLKNGTLFSKKNIIAP